MKLKMEKKLFGPLEILFGPRHLFSTGPNKGEPVIGVSVIKHWASSIPESINFR